ncbi:hypothetical protein ANN_17979 [Periplaneta americana]|uniref:Uncharacterized protein n=1 Tax=Periplaneta americana TaxID=6978 RepID=A0ABQ8SNQ0_PERAM|nr:hypothetical protein ANN_17979 [Periplaneta americana]
MAGLCEGGNEPSGSLKASPKASLLTPPVVREAKKRVDQDYNLAECIIPVVDLSREPVGFGALPYEDCSRFKAG